MNPPVHLDEAIDSLAGLFRGLPLIEKALIIEDSIGRISIGVWGDPSNHHEIEKLAKIAGGPFFSGSLFWESENRADIILDLAKSWDDGRPWREFDEDGSDKIRHLVRFRNLTSWQVLEKEPLWPLSLDHPALVVFFSYKGGLGRTTTVAAFAIQRANLGEKVVVLDLDLEAPGIDILGRFCFPDPRYGIADYLIETPHLSVPADLEDYYRTIAEPELVGEGSIAVFPAGIQDASYLGKVARLDMEWGLARHAGVLHPFQELLTQIRNEIKPDWILIDSRTGFSEVAGLLLSGIAHFHVLMGVDSTQSWNGLEHVVCRLGEDRLDRGLAQSDLAFVQAMVPASVPSVSYESKAERLFFEHFYREVVEVGEETEGVETGSLEGILDIADAEDSDAPHRVLRLAYNPDLAQEVELSNPTLRRALMSGAYLDLGNRIAQRLGREETNGQT